MNARQLNEQQSALLEHVPPVGLQAHDAELAQLESAQSV